MKTHIENSFETKKEAISKEERNKSKTANQSFQFVDNRPETIAQLKMQEMLKNSQQTMQMNNEQERPNVNNTTTEELSKKEIAPFQLKEDPTGDAPPNGDTSNPNKTGLPDNLKSGMESLSGMTLDDVKVHYNSEKPAQLQALAYAQGTDIHLGPGQEEHLPHELGHVVQQKKGTVKPTMQMMGKSEGVPVNDDPRLEREADLMGGEALQMKANEKELNPITNLKHGISALSSGKGPVQREEDPNADPTAEEVCDPNAEPIAEEEYQNTDPYAECNITEGETDSSTGIGDEGDESYKNQRDNPVLPDATCNVTTLTMQLLGLADGDEAKVKQSALALCEKHSVGGVNESTQLEEILRQLTIIVAGSEEIDGIKAWKYSWVLDKTAELFTNLVDHVDNAGDDLMDITTQEKYNNKIVPALNDGAEVMLSTQLTSSGHIVFLVSVRDDGIVINDPYGMMVKDGNYIRNAEKVTNGKKTTITSNQSIVDNRLKLNSSMKTIIMQLLQSSDTFPANSGEKNFYTWDEVNTYKIGKWCNVAYKQSYAESPQE